MMILRRLIVIACAGLLIGVPASAQAGGAYFQQTNLVSDVPGLARFTGSNLKNPWGIAFGESTPFWVSNQVTGTATIYDGTGQPQSLVVTIPPAGGGNPTGQVFNSSSDFALGGGTTSALF